MSAFPPGRTACALVNRRIGKIMDIFDTLTMLGGLALFLFGMSLMGQALERRAG